MKKDGLYRFSIQFPGNSEEQVRAGEFLERLGRKKGIVIVTALNDYLERNPHLLQEDTTIQIHSEISSKSLEQLVRRLIDEQLSGVELVSASAAKTEINAGAIQQDIVDMLGDLELFQL